jgi:hypothetical protein
MSELQSRQSANLDDGNGFKSSLHQLSAIPTQQQQQQQQFNPPAVATLDRRLFQQQQLGRRRQRGNEYVIQPGMGFTCSPMKYTRNGLNLKCFCLFVENCSTFGRAQKPSFQINASATNLLSGYHENAGGAPCHIILDHQQTLPQQTVNMSCICSKLLDLTFATPTGFAILRLL